MAPLGQLENVCDSMILAYNHVDDEVANCKALPQDATFDELMKCGEVFDYAGDFKTAVDTYTQAVSRAMKNSDQLEESQAHFTRGVSLTKWGRPCPAADDFLNVKDNKASSLELKRDSYIQLAKSECQTPNEREAFAKSAMVLDPNCIEASMLLGNYETVLKIDPDNREAKQGIMARDNDTSKTALAIARDNADSSFDFRNCLVVLREDELLLTADHAAEAHYLLATAHLELDDEWDYENITSDSCKHNNYAQALFHAKEATRLDQSNAEYEELYEDLNSQGSTVTAVSNFVSGIVKYVF